MIQSVAIGATEGSFAWVESWLAARYTGVTYTGYLGSWRQCQRYFREKEITTFSAITRQHCYDFLLWRKVARNTAYKDLRVLSVILHEAVLRGLIPANPAAQLRIKMQPVAKLKPEFPDAILEEIMACILKETSKHREFYRVSFLVARYTGCRLAETRFPLSNVDFESNTITFRTKGSHDHTVPLHPKLRPVLKELAERGQGWTFAEPSNPNYMSIYWQKFMVKHGIKAKLPFSCFHSLRVTAATRMARANVSEAKAMRFLRHGSSTIHRVYLRVRVADLEDCCAALA